MSATYLCGIAIRDVVNRRMREGLTDDLFLFPLAKTATFDNAIARACRQAGKLAKLKYGQANGFTTHSLRHTFITDLMEKTGNDAGTVMKYSGHKTLELFRSTCIPPNRGGYLLHRRWRALGFYWAVLRDKGDNRDGRD